MPNLHRILVEGTEEFEGSISWAYLRGILSSPRFRHLKISVAVDLNHAATFTTELDFSLPPLTSLTLTIPDYKYHPRHDNVKAKLLSAFLPKLSLTLECLSISLDVAPLQLIGTLQWPRLRELTLQGDRRVSLDPEFASIALSAGMPELRSFSILRAQRSKRRRHTLWPAEWTGGVPFSKLERLEVSYPIPADEIYSHLPDTLRRLSLRCWPRHYHHRYRYERDAMRRLWWKSPILTASELLTILRRCQAAPLEHLEIEYEVDDHDEALLRSLSELFPALRTLTVFRYRPKDHTGEIQVESIARALSNLLHLRVLRIHLDFPHAPHPLSPIETWSCFAELDAFQAFLSIPAETLARNLSSSLRFVCLFQRRMYENVWFPFRIIRDPSAGTRGSRSTVQKVLLDDAVLSIEGLR
ncbi:hypothetical protein FKP32DRAFT_1567565 [Trametes sanguinea]|nr:hypothetical protein FKP32DRAFT_1567565 [Trametes sanguinea]